MPVALYNRLPIVVPSTTGSTIDPWTCYPLYPRKPRMYDPTTTQYAEWSYGPDAAGLKSLSSGHVAAATGTMTYATGSVTTPAANSSGLDLKIADSQIFTAWVVVQVPAALGFILGTSAADGDTQGWWIRSGGSGQLTVTSKGGTFSNGNLFMPSGVVAGTSYVFVSIASDATSMEAYCGGGSGSRVTTGANTPYTTRNLALGALYSTNSTYSQAITIVDAGVISGTRYTLAQMQVLYAARKAAVLAEKGITVL